MPELPDVELYVARLRERVIGTELLRIALYTPFVLRSVAPTPSSIEGRAVCGVERLGKRIAIGLDGDAYLVLHLMIAGRLIWTPGAGEPKRAGGKAGVLTLGFGTGRLALVEFGTKKRASLHLAEGRDALEALGRGGLDVLTCSHEAFAGRIRSENRTLKRALTSPSLFDGIGNAYSDEILHAARLSPLRLTSALSDDEVERLATCCRDVLVRWRDRLQGEIADFPTPKQITAFRPGFAAHGRYGKPCPDCGAPIQRIVYADNETDYCARCQNEGRLLADRGLSRLLKQDWPKTLDEMMSE